MFNLNKENLNKGDLNIIELKKYMNLKEFTNFLKILGLIICSLVLISSIMIHFGNSLSEIITITIKVII